MVAWSSLENAPAITLRGERLALAIIKKVKRLENRHVKLKGWVWIHAGQGVTAAEHAKIIDDHTEDCPEDRSLRGFIIGAAHFYDVVSVEQARADPLLAPWAFGPHCALIDDTFVLKEPVWASGFVGKWTKGIPYDALQSSFNASSCTPPAPLV